MLKIYLPVIAISVILFASCIQRATTAESTTDKLAGTSWKSKNPESSLESLTFVDTAHFMKLTRAKDDLVPTSGTWKCTADQVVELKTATVTEQVEVGEDKLVLNGEILLKEK